MVYRFTMVSDEVDDFVREFQISPDATFFDLHTAILKSVGFTDDEPTSFFVCNEDWEREHEVTLEAMNDESSEEDSYIMKDTELSELVEDEGQKLTYVFDVMTERSFFLELTEIITRKESKTPQCTRSQGEPPQQKVDFEEAAKQMNIPAGDDLGENFYGDKDYDEEDLDEEGYGVDGEGASYEQ